MPTSIVTIRKSAYINQSGRCYYCSLPMWENDLELFSKKYGVKTTEALRLKSTAEHLHARQDGGKNSKDNIVAACVYCNQHRHYMRPAPEPSAYKKIVLKQLRNGYWHKKVIVQRILLALMIERSELPINS